MWRRLEKTDLKTKSVWIKPESFGSRMLLLQLVNASLLSHFVQTR